MTTYRHVGHVFFDELDPLGFLHNARFAVHVERAFAVFLGEHGFPWQADVADNPDQYQVVGRFEIEFQVPFRGTGPLAVELSLDHLGRTSMRNGFRCLGTDDVVHATGSRSVVKLDPTTQRPTPWTWRDMNLRVLAN
ncbi:acyl-CoA thioesterase [Actinokineospora enzanensis]|uniref:acyl-CoA thioesterase n=1 Tax=Actinokineospora enzanensis TaxID=155975 RepID=UPI00036E7C6F|nr:hotdog domain-containing protein [Actinokineospora enzanensis]